MWYFITGIILYIISFLVFKCLEEYDYNSEGVIENVYKTVLYLYMYIIGFLLYLLAWPIIFTTLFITLICALVGSYKCKRDEKYPDIVVEFKNKKVQKIIDKMVGIWFKEI